MADHDQPTPVGGQEVAQPDDRVRVEVVGGLVQQHGVSPGEQDPRQLDASPLATAERGERLAEDPVLDAEAGRDLRGLGLGGVPAAGVQLGVGPLVAAHRVVPDLWVVAAHLGLGGAQAADDVVEPARGQDPFAGEHVGVTRARVLREVADGPGALHRSRSGQRLAGEDLGERGLAGAVAPDQPHLVPGGDAEADAFHQEPRTGSDFQLVGGDHVMVSVLACGSTRRPPSTLAEPVTLVKGAPAGV